MATVLKQSMSGLAAAILPQCRYERTLFVFGHMRCGSTALSNVLCEHPEVSGFGESHTNYKNRSSLGLLALKQIRTRRWKPGAAYLFDKLLHPYCDRDAPTELFSARAIFAFRDPVATVLSIRHLYSKLGLPEYSTDAIAADYYAERLDGLTKLWTHFAPDRRIALTFDRLTTEPEVQLERISKLVGINVDNVYKKPLVTRIVGAGDPIAASRFDRIVSSDVSSTITGPRRALQVSDAKLALLEKRYNDARALMLQES